MVEPGSRKSQGTVRKNLEKYGKNEKYGIRKLEQKIRYGQNCHGKRP
jgi:hypothetical protein